MSLTDSVTIISARLNEFKMPQPSRRTVVALLWLLIGCSIGMGQALAYDNPVIYNHTKYDANITVEYASAFCSDDKYEVPRGKEIKSKFVPTSRSPDVGRDTCLITKVHLSMINGPSAATKPQFDYKSSGTSYHEFHILDRGNHYRVMSNHEVDAGKYEANGTPGFHITNRSEFPVTVSLDQVGCLYHDVIKPGETWKKTTGAVWFTISANTSFDGEDDINELEDCVYPVIKAVKFAAEFGAALAGCATCANAAIGDAENFAASLAGTALYNAITDNMTAKKLPGQYAGPPYPFRCAEAPRYDIVGGPANVDVTMSPEQIKAAKVEACSIKPVLGDLTGRYFSRKFMEKLAEGFNAEEFNSKNQIPSDQQITELKLFFEPSQDKKIAQELANCKAHGSRHACLALEPGFDFDKFQGQCKADMATWFANQPESKEACEKKSGALGLNSCSLQKHGPGLGEIPSCNLPYTLGMAINGQLDREIAREAKAVAACELTPAIKQAWFTENMGLYTGLAGTPLEIKRTGGGCT
jgi:hypothetical protein